MSTVSTYEVAHLLGVNPSTVHRRLAKHSALFRVKSTPSGRRRLTIEDVRTLASLMGRDPNRVEVLLSAA